MINQYPDIALWSGQYLDITQEKTKQLAVDCTKEALIGEHNQKPLLVIAQKKALIGTVLWEISKL